MYTYLNDASVAFLSKHTHLRLIHNPRFYCAIKSMKIKKFTLIKLKIFVNLEN